MIHSSLTRQQLPTNFRKGGMKKLMEDEEFARNVQATYFATSAGIHVKEG
jgi:hypothetical protein